MWSHCLAQFLAPPNLTARWSIWFEFFLLVIMMATCFSKAFDRARFIYLTYLALVTVLLTQVCLRAHVSLCRLCFTLGVRVGGCALR